MSSAGARGAYGVSGEVNWLAPFLQGASLRYQLEAAKDEWRAVRINYVKTTMAAFKDVADTLVTLERLREERAESERQVNALRRAGAARRHAVPRGNGDLSRRHQRRSTARFPPS